MILRNIIKRGRGGEVSEPVGNHKRGVTEDSLGTTALGEQCGGMTRVLTGVSGAP